MPLALRPANDFLVLPGGSSRPQLLRPVCPPLPATAQASLPVFSGETTGFPGSYLITEMGSGWLPNTFPRIGGLRTGSSTSSRRFWPSESTLRFPQPSTFAGLQFSWYHRPRIPTLAWSCLAFATDRLTPAHPFLKVCLLEVGLPLTTRSCPLEADQFKTAWHLEPLG